MHFGLILCSFNLGFSDPGVLAVSPEGVIRHWPVVGRQFNDSVVELQSEVALSLLVLNGHGSGNFYLNYF